MRNGRMEYYSWTKHSMMTMDTPIEKTKMPDRAINEKATNDDEIAAIAENKKRTNCCIL